MPTSVLVIDDSRRSRDNIAEILLKAGLFDYCRGARDGLEGFKFLSAARPDLVICDVEMPRLDGLKFLQMLHGRPELQEIPVIMLTVNRDRKVRLQGLEHGASDFLTKPFDAAELVARVRIHLKIKQLQDQLRAAKDHFKQLSNIDPLTNLYNRRFLMEILESELQRARRLRSSLSLLIVDLDHFKEVNDRHGHQTGDGVLVQVADALRRGLRSYDVASRYGGEEFVLLLPGTPIAEAVAVAERLRREVESLKITAATGAVSTTVSIGVACSTAADEASPEIDPLFRRADAALYRAKNNGRNRVVAL
jgi:two-component system, cell cycle response regulator